MLLSSPLLSPCSVSHTSPEDAEIWQVLRYGDPSHAAAAVRNLNGFEPKPQVSFAVSMLKCVNSGALQLRYDVGGACITVARL